MYPTNITIVLIALVVGFSTVRAATIPEQPSNVAVLESNVAVPESDNKIPITLTHTTTTGTVTSVDVVTTSVSCVRTWCHESSSLCLYWAGVTGWNASKGVVPGMTAVPFAPCSTTESTTPMVFTSGPAAATPTSSE